MKKILNSEQGFSLVSILIASSIVAALIVALLQVGELSKKNLKTAEVQSEFFNYHNQILAFLRTQENCNATFAGHYFGDDLAELYRHDGITQEDGVNIAKIAPHTIPGSNYQLKSIKIINPLEKNNVRVPASVSDQLKILAEKPSLKGWDTLVEFKYEFIGKTQGHAQKTLMRYHPFKFNNLSLVGFVKTPLECEVNTPPTFFVPGIPTTYSVTPSFNLSGNTAAPQDPVNLVPCYNATIASEGPQYIKECAML